MKFKYTIIFILLFVRTLCSQQTNDAFMFAPGAQQQQIIPQSPEAGNLGRYGSLPMTSATGQMSYSIPFYNIEVDGNSWPIGLNYNYGGLILEGKPSLLGLGWNLQGEAAVTREVRGLADEHKFGYNSVHSSGTDVTRTVRQLINDYTYYEFDDGDNTNSGLDTWTMNTLRKFRDGFYDSEPDKYTVNIGGKPFSFKINLDLLQDEQVYFLSKHSNKVEIQWGEANSYVDSGNREIIGFIVTDENGIKYNFDFIENSELLGRDNVFYLNPITSWKLSSITYLNGQEATFGYTSNSLLDYNFRVAASAILSNVSGVSENPNGYQPSPFQPGNSIYLNPQYGDNISVWQINRNILTTIVFPTGHIEFKYNPAKNLYESIELFDKNPIPNSVKKFDFTHSGNRDFLDEISFNGESYYQFEYHNEVSIPDFIKGNTQEDKSLARRQDFWKFYNGESNDFALNVPNSAVDGVNRNPSLLHSRLGALKRIIYPTKGSTNIFYEQNQIEADFDIDDSYLRSLSVGKKSFLELDAMVHNEKTRTRTLEILHPTVAIISHYINGDRSGSGIDLQLTRTDGAYNYPVTIDGVSVPPYPGANQFYYDVAPYLKQKLVEYNAPYTIPPMYPNLVKQFGYADTDNGTGGLIDTINETTYDKILIMPGTYEMKISVGALGANVRGSITIQMFGKFNQPFPNRINKDIGGIRVDYMKDCPDNFGENCVITDYNYNDAEGFSTGVQYVVPQISTKYTLDHIDLPGANTIPGATYRTEIVTFTENPFTVSDPLMGTPVFYRKIATTKRKNGSVFLASNAQIGRVETTYSLPMESRAYSFPSHPTGVDLNKSLALETISFEAGNEQSVSVNRNGYQPIRDLLNVSHNQDEDNRHPWGLKVHINRYRNISFSNPDGTFDEDYNTINPPLGSPADLKLKDLHGIKAYRELDIWDRLGSVTNEIDGISKYTSYKHNDDNKIIEEKTTDSRGNETVKSIKYAREVGFNEMVAKNQLSTPIETETSYNDNLISKSKTDFILNGNGYKPSKTFVAKGDGVLEAKMKITYHPSRPGKVIQVDQLLDSPNRYENEDEEKVLKSTSYLWGYNNEYPVIKAENITYSELTGTIANLARLQSTFESLINKQQELNLLRSNLPNAFINGYTYKPLIGIENIIDSRGYTTFYQYDFLNRLLNVKDENQKMLKEYQYEFRTANYENPDDGDFDSITAELQGVNQVEINDTQTYTVEVTGGSGNIDYSWSYNNAPLTDNTNSIAITFDSGNSATIAVDVTDLDTGETLSLEQVVSISSDLGLLTLNVNRLIAETNEPFNFTASGLQTGSGNLSYQWLINNNEQTTTATTSYNTSFGTVGTYVVKLIVTDNETLATTENEITVTVYDILLTPIIETNQLHVLYTRPIDFTTQNVGGGSNDKSYSWSLNGNTLTGETGLTISESLSLGENVISFTVRDNILNKTRSASITVTAYEFLSIDNIYSNVNNITVTEAEAGNMVRFIAQGFTGNANDQTGQWYLNGQLQPGETSTIMDRTLNQIGNYTATYRRTHKYLTNSSDEYLYKEKSTQFTVTSNLGSMNLTSNRMVAETDETFNFTANGLQSGLGNLTYTWYINNNPQTTSATTVYGTSFATVGSYTVKLIVTDNQTLATTEDNITVTVYNKLQSPTIDTNKAHVLFNRPVDFTAQNIVGGSNDKSYSWSINGNTLSGETGLSISENLSFGDNVVSFTVTDNVLNEAKTVNTTVSVYEFLEINSIYSNVNNQTVTETITGNMVRFIAQGFTGNSGDQTGQWYLNGVIQSGETSTIMDRTFNSPGTYTATYRRTHKYVTNPSGEYLYTEKSTQIEVFADLTISEIITNPDSPITVNTSTNFNINALTGSGSYTYLWNYNGYSSTSKSFNLNIDYNYYGTKIASCKVTDTRTGISKTVTKYITVNGAPALTAKQVVVQVFNSNDIEYNSKIGISNLNGSGNYSYSWTVDGQNSGSLDNTNIYITCSDQSDYVVCTITDNISGNTKTVTKTYTFTGNCSGGGTTNPKGGTNQQ